MADIGTAGREIPPSEITKPQDAITILCELSSEVAQNVFEYQSTADCFCGERQEWVEKGLWQHDGDTIQFIIDATRAAIALEIGRRQIAERMKEH